MRASTMRAAAVAALLTIGLSGEALARKTGEPFHWDGVIPPGKTLKIRGVNGQIHAVLGTGNRTVVDAAKWGRSCDPGRVVIEAHEEADEVVICARYPKRWGRGLTSCEDASGAKGDVNVDFTVKLPAGVEAVFINVNGGIRAEGVRSPIRAVTVNGSVRVATTEPAEAKTVNGSIVARMQPRAGEDLDFASVNGSIRIEIPERSDADVKAVTVNGSISSDFPVTIRGKWIGRKLEGVIGKGGSNIGMATVNGSISLRAI